MVLMTAVHWHGSPLSNPSWDCDRILWGRGKNGLQWKCFHCNGNPISGNNATKALNHILKFLGCHIHPWPAIIPGVYVSWYELLLSFHVGGQQNKKVKQEMREKQMENDQDYVASKIKKRKFVAFTWVPGLPPIGQTIHGTKKQFRTHSNIFLASSTGIVSATTSKK